MQYYIMMGSVMMILSYITIANYIAPSVRHLIVDIVLLSRDGYTCNLLDDMHVFYRHSAPTTLTKLGFFYQQRGVDNDAQRSYMNSLKIPHRIWFWNENVYVLTLIVN